jgi:hypothetical protein
MASWGETMARQCKPSLETTSRDSQWHLSAHRAAALQSAVTTAEQLPLSSQTTGGSKVHPRPYSKTAVTTAAQLSRLSQTTGAPWCTRAANSKSALALPSICSSLARRYHCTKR